MGMAETIFDQDAMTTLAQVPDDVIVLQQDPLAGGQVCRVSEVQYMIDLVVDLAGPMMTTFPPDITTQTTILPEKSEVTTTTSVKPKATTTTKP
jgi:hypothetical protein